METVAQSNIGMYKQPRPFYMVFFIEMWERFGYAGLQTVLAMFLVKSIGMSDVEAFAIFGAFYAMVNGYVAIGGYIGDHILGTKRTIVLGGITLLIGYVIIGLAGADKMSVFTGIACVAVGNGLFKANPASLLSKIYAKDDPRLDGAFTLYHMAINTGAFMAMILVPMLGGRFGAQTGFFVCAAGLVLSLCTFVFYRNIVKDIDSPPGKLPLPRMKLMVIIVGVIATIYLSAWMLTNLAVAHWLLAIVGTGVFVRFFYEAFKRTGLERSKMLAAFVLMLEAIAFFVIGQQMPTSLNFFTINNVEHTVWGIRITDPESFQALNPFWIIVASPILAYFYSYFGKQGKDLTIPAKFATGMVCCAVSFLVLVLGITTANAQGLVSVWWLVSSYFFSSVGELMISGLGLAMVAKLVPQEMVGFTIGAWYLSSATAGVISGKVAAFAAVPKGMTDSLQTLPIYFGAFMKMGIGVGIIALLVLALVPVLRKMIHEQN